MQAAVVPPNRFALFRFQHLLLVGAVLALTPACRMLTGQWRIFP